MTGGQNDRMPTTAPAGLLDLVVVGGGLVGLATAREFLLRRPDARVAVVEAEAEVALLLRRRCTWMDVEGIPRNVEGPMAKLFSSESLVRAAQDLFDLIGPDGARSFLDPSAPRSGRVEYLMRFSLGTTIYAGTSEVQRTMIAQRGLGLPRS